MTKTEALKAAIDGKKIRCDEWVNQQAYVFWRENCFIHKSEINGNSEQATAQITYPGFVTWQIVPEYVDFAEAWKAYENGKTIQDMFTHLYNKKEERCRFVDFDSKSIRGKWLILED